MKKMTRREMLGYGIGALGLDLSYGLVTSSFLMKYFTDVLYILPGFIGVIFFIARIWDGINDPMMGTIVDNTKSKWGRFRPWILLGAVLNAVILFFIFTNPGFRLNSDKINYGLYVYVAVMYILWGMTYTLVDIPYWSLIPALTTNMKERNKIATVSRFFSGFGQFIIAGLTVMMISRLGRGNDAAGYSRWALICGVLMILVNMVTVFSTKERITTSGNEKFTFRKAVKTIASNDQLLVFIITAICFNTGWYLTNGLGLYYFENVLDRKSSYAVFAVIVGAGQFIGLILFSLLTRKLSKYSTIKFAMCSAFFGYIGMYIFGVLVNVYALFILFAVFASIGIGCMFVSETVMLADIVDYGEYKLGYRTDSIVFSMKSFLLKMAMSIQSLIIGAGLQLAHYQEGVTGAAQPARDAICVMMLLIPPVLIGISYIVFVRKYKLKGEMLLEVNSFITKQKRSADSDA